MIHPRRPARLHRRRPEPPGSPAGRGGIGPGQLAGALERVAEAIGLEIRRERLDIGDARLPGGLCRLNDRRPVCILADNLGEQEERRIIGLALLTFDLDAVWMPPAARDYLAALQRESDRR